MILGQGTKIPQVVGFSQIRKKKKREKKGKKKLKSPEIKVTTSKMSINILPDISLHKQKSNFFMEPNYRVLTCFYDMSKS